MAFDFEVLLVGLTAISGVVWLLNALVFRSDGVMAEYGRSFFPVLLFVVVLRSFVVEPFRIRRASAGIRDRHRGRPDRSRCSDHRG